MKASQQRVRMRLRQRGQKSRWCRHRSLRVYNFFACLALFVTLMPAGDSSESLSAEGQALRAMLLSSSNLREAIEHKLAYAGAMTRDSHQEQEARSPRLVQQGIGRWLKAGVHPTNATRVEVEQSMPMPVTQAEHHPTVCASDEILRGRDDALERVREILDGELSPQQLQGLLRYAAGDVTAAVNLFLDAQSTGSVENLLKELETVDAKKLAQYSMAGTPPPSFASLPCRLEQWNKRIFAGNNVACEWEESWPKKLGLRHIKAYLTRSLRMGFLERGAPLMFWRPRPVPVKSVRKSQLQGIIRFAAEARVRPQAPAGEGEEGLAQGAARNQYERCEGRLPTDVARVLAPLMDAGVIQVQGSVCSPPLPCTFSGESVLFEGIGIDLEVYLMRPALARAHDFETIAALLSLLGAEQVRKAHEDLDPKPTTHTSRPQTHHHDQEPKPTISQATATSHSSSAVPSSTHTLPSESSSHTLLPVSHQPDADPVIRRQACSDSDARSSAKMLSTTGCSPAHPQTLAEEEGRRRGKARPCTTGGGMGARGLAEAQVPSGFKSGLKRFQRQGLGWMLAREAEGSQGGCEEGEGADGVADADAGDEGSAPQEKWGRRERPLHPLWSEWYVPVGPSGVEERDCEDEEGGEHGTSEGGGSGVPQSAIENKTSERGVHTARCSTEATSCSVNHGEATLHELAGAERQRKYMTQGGGPRDRDKKGQEAEAAAVMGVKEGHERAGTCTPQCRGDGGTLVKRVFVKVTDGRLLLSPPRACRRVRGGILADAMGLGKTVQTLALIASDAEPDKEAKSQEKETTTHAPDEMEQDSSRTESEGEGGKGRKVRGAEGQHVGPKSAGGETRTRAGRHAATSAATSAATLATLVVCPTSILQQWADEARRHLVWGEEGGRVVIYHGSQRAAGLSTAALRRARLVLTSYGVVAAEFSHAGGAASVRCRGQGGSETHAEEGGDVNLFDVAWYRVVLDEAHLIKSRSSVSSRAVVALPTERRWALTGTPLHNTCDDLLALLLFLRAEPWADASWWNRAILRPLTQNPGDQGVLQLLRGILGTLMLRRTARSSPSSTRHPDGGLVAGRLMNGGEEGEEGEEETAVVGQPRGEERCVDADDDDEGGGCSVDIDLPAKVVEVEEVVFSEEERGVYDAIFAQSKLKYEELVTGGALMSNYACVLEMLLRLRQACVHSLLLSPRGEHRAAAAPQAFANLTSHLLSATSTGAAAGTASDSCSTKERMEVMVYAEDRAVDDKADGEGGRTVGGSSYVLDVMSRAQEGVMDDCAVCLEPVMDAVVTPCAHVFCRHCLLQVVLHQSSTLSRAAPGVSPRRKRERSGRTVMMGRGGGLEGGETRCPRCRALFRAADVRAVPRKESFLEQVRARWRPSAKTKALIRDLKSLQQRNTRALCLAQDKSRSVPLARNSTWSSPGPPPALGASVERDDAHSHEAGGATDYGAGACGVGEDEGGKSTRAVGVGEGEGGKSVVFSQWTSVLDLVEVALDRAGISYVRLDGSMSPQQRSASLARLQGLPAKHPRAPSLYPSILNFARPRGQKPKRGEGLVESGVEEGVAAHEDGRGVDVILMSLKAGGMGLNLVCCSNVFLLDPWWNPQMEEQAIARLHRIGQHRTVRVKRYIVRDTVEHNILRLQQRKQLLFQDALGQHGDALTHPNLNTRTAQPSQFSPHAAERGQCSGENVWARSAPVELLGQLFSPTCQNP